MRARHFVVRFVALLLCLGVNLSGASFAQSSPLSKKCGEFLSLGLFPMMGPMVDLRDGIARRKQGHPLSLSNFKFTAKTIAAYLTLYFGINSISSGLLVTSDRDFQNIGETYQQVSPKKILFIDAMHTNRWLVETEYNRRVRLFPNAKIERLYAADPEDMVTKVAALEKAGERFRYD